MEKGINLQIAELKQKLTDVINKANLPIAITQMAIFELSANVNNLVARQLDMERRAYEKTLEEKDEAVEVTTQGVDTNG